MTANKLKNNIKTSTREELESLNKDDLIDKIIKLELQNIQLQQTLKKIQNKNESFTNNAGKERKRFDFSKYHKRHIFLKLYYLGWNHQGFVVQEDTQNTIEHHLFSALIKSCCIESRETSNYHRCGRTDKGVSAYSQVISIDVRSCLEPIDQANIADELPYCKILNRLLPKSIRCIAWSPVNENMSARFDCQYRMYKYFFPRGNLNIEAMNVAAKYLIGSHDFRNLCKMDVGNGVTNFGRTIIDAEVTCVQRSEDNLAGYDMCSLIIKSQAFLWHQIRCIMGILILIGREKEQPEVVLDLLDIKKCPCKPQYNMALELPLNLFYCQYENVNWKIDDDNIRILVKDLQEEWALNSIKSLMVKSMIKDLTPNLTNLQFQDDCLLQGAKSKVYQLLMNRITCESLENRIEHFAKRRKIDFKQTK